MNRSIPVQLLSVIENWFALCLSCVKWGKATSYFYKLTTGVRQGGVLSPCFFGIFIDDLVKLVNKADSGCRIGACCAAFICMPMILFCWRHPLALYKLKLPFVN